MKKEIKALKGVDPLKTFPAIEANLPPVWMDLGADPMLRQGYMEGRPLRVSADTEGVKVLRGLSAVTLPLYEEGSAAEACAKAAQDERDAISKVSKLCGTVHPATSGYSHITTNPEALFNQIVMEPWELENDSGTRHYVVHETTGTIIQEGFCSNDVDLTNIAKMVIAHNTAVMHLRENLGAQALLKELLQNQGDILTSIELLASESSDTLKRVRSLEHREFPEYLKSK